MAATKTTTLQTPAGEDAFDVIMQLSERIEKVHGIAMAGRDRAESPIRGAQGVEETLWWVAMDLLYEASSLVNQLRDMQRREKSGGRTMSRTTRANGAALALRSQLGVVREEAR